MGGVLSRSCTPDPISVLMFFAVHILQPPGEVTEALGESTSITIDVLGVELVKGIPQCKSNYVIYLSALSEHVNTYLSCTYLGGKAPSSSQGWIGPRLQGEIAGQRMTQPTTH